MAKKAKKTSRKAAPRKTASQKNDITSLIKEDHKPLKQLIRILKDSEKHDLDERMEAFEEFAPLLVNHAKSEEQTLYVAMKKTEDFREEGFEGDVEHTLADQLLEEIKRTEEEDLWSARVKVLAELVEHHIEEEEEEMLPEYKKETALEERVALGEMFLDLKTKFAEMGNEDAPSEDSLEDEVSEERKEESRANH
jgi:hypothetical protein